MPGLIAMDSPSLCFEVPDLGYTLSHQTVELEIDFRGKSVVGRTELTIIPQTKDFKSIKINSRQCELITSDITINDRPATIKYEDPYIRLAVPSYVQWTAAQHEMQRERIKALIGSSAGSGELAITVPKSVHVEEIDPFAETATNSNIQKTIATAPPRSSSIAGTLLNASVSTPTATPKTAEDPTERYLPINIVIPFTLKNPKDGLHFVGLEAGDSRYPHVYTRNSIQIGIASTIFPCVDDPSMRCTWKISIKCSRTLGDALKKPGQINTANDPNPFKRMKMKGQTNGLWSSQKSQPGHFPEIDLSDEDKLLDMSVICSGDLIDEAADPADSSRKITTFVCENQIAAQHVGFAVGPFEHVDLTEFREVDEDEKLGQKAIHIHGYCLPGRSDEVRNTCEAMAHAVDYFTLTFGSYPYSDYSMCFVDDQVADTVPVASMSLCSSRLLFPEDIIDPEVENTRTLTHALASQWIGVNIVPVLRSDYWIVVGISHFITGLFMKNLCGNNEYRYRQKMLNDRLVELDINRPSLHSLGEILYLGKYELDFLTLKAPLVLFILDKRLSKASGSTGLVRVIGKMFFAANTGGLAERLVSTDGFRRLCEKVGHYKLESFWTQWVTGAGCPRFSINHKFNKKRLTVEMHISQKQDTLPTQRKMQKDAFMREFKEETGGVYAGELQPVFTGPMTIRIHEADGTPYEHIVEIREGTQRIEIPYNTKYKRLKRSRRQKERANAGAGVDMNADNQDDVLLYCLGDVLQSQDEVRDWGLQDWDAENEQRMDQESYEWIRMDADFEWLCEMSFSNMPAYMYVSQLQQDRDVVAQLDSMLYLQKSSPHPLVSTFLVRTLMDRRYFHGIRTLAAECLAKHATETCNWIGRIHLEKAYQEFYCYPGSAMPQANDFNDKTAYIIKSAISRSMASIRDADGRCPAEARQFVLDQLRFNDNGNNDYSDNYYIAGLLDSLADSLIPRRDTSGGMSFEFDDEEGAEDFKKFQRSAIEAIDRHRRMDEWLQSFKNLYTTTALECKRKLMKANVITPDPLEFVQYVHDGSLDEVRLKAFECLVDLGLISSDAVLELTLSVMSTDSSPYLRSRLLIAVYRGLAAIAFGEHRPTIPAATLDGLIVEQESDQELAARRSQIARTTSIDGALGALREELQHNTYFKEKLWDAVCSEKLGVAEQASLLDICWILYEPVEAMPISFRYPRYWQVQHVGNCVMRFQETEKIRTKRIAKKLGAKPALLKIVPPPPSPAAPSPAAAPVRTPLRISAPAAASSTMKPPKRPLTIEKNEGPDVAQRPQKMIKLRFNGFHKLVPPITTSSTTPAKQSSKRRASSTLPLQSPAPSSASGTSPAPARKPLPGFGSAASPATAGSGAQASTPTANSASPPPLAKKATLKIKFNIQKPS